MRYLGLLVLLLLALPAHADTANVGESTRLLDFNISKAPADGVDIDADGQISRAEAAGNEELSLAFDRADRNRNGRISDAEWRRYEKWRERRDKAREARLARAKAKESAAAGGTGGKKKEKK